MTAPAESLWTEPDDPEPALSLPPAIRARVRHLDRICAELEDGILRGRGDVTAMRTEYRACQDEMREIER